MRGNVRFKNILSCARYEGQLKRARITGASQEYSIIKESLRNLRDMATAILQDNMSEDDAGLVAAMTLGDKSELDTEIKELYQVAGISHVLALSGRYIKRFLYPYLSNAAVCGTSRHSTSGKYIGL